MFNSADLMPLSFLQDCNGASFGTPIRVHGRIRPYMAENAPTKGWRVCLPLKDHALCYHANERVLPRSMHGFDC
jgi:hypothetical protein